VLSVVPYNMILKRDPGSPLFISFVLHVVVVGASLPRAGELLRGRRIPLAYHAVMVLLGCLFTTLKSDAYVRLPAPVCLLLSNLRMLVGVVVQAALFGKRHSASQLCGVAVVTFGIAWASNATQPAGSQPHPGGPGSSDFAVGVVEVLLSTLSLSLLSSLVKVAFARFGESVEEQIFVQHLCSLPLVFPSQWDKVGPRLWDWAAGQDAWLILNLAASVLLTFGARSAAAQMAGRAPSLLTAQLVQTLECFLQLLVVALLRAPPLPPAGFWLGTAALVAGSLQYLRASAAPPGG